MSIESTAPENRPQAGPDTPPGAAFDRHIPTIIAALADSGLAVIENALPAHTRAALRADVANVTLTPASIGRAQEQHRNESIRRDSIAWFDGTTPAQQDWLKGMEQLRSAINRELFLGLFDYECHYAHYQPGQFYRRHRDAFAGNRVAHARVLSTVCYLNDEWQVADGGELEIFDNDEKPLLKVAPRPGTLVIFLSESFPHEVLPTAAARYSIAGWFRRS